MRQPAYPKHSPRIAALHLACGALIGVLPLANASPTGGVVVGGSGTIAQSGTSTVINQATQNLAINWDTFNVAANERVQFIQPGATSIALNRILSNNGSIIAGRIDANGRIILVNANGILFTSTAVLNVGSLAASSLDINPSDFMNGQYLFSEIPGANGAIVNQGMIHASLGGNVALLGKQVRNEGTITANLGSVTLAAGKEAVLTFEDGGLLGVRVTKEVLQSELGVDPAVLNSGEIQAQGGRVLLTASQSQDVFSRAVNTTGLEPATSVVVNDDGTFTLGAGADVLNTGSINVSGTAAGQNGGQIVLLGNNVTSSGTLNANAQSGNGGEIELHATNTTLLTQNSLTSARSETNGQGGIVKVLGDQVGLFDQSTVDVSGANGGGQALIGGDFQGKNTKIRNSSATIINPGASIYADALENGNGGKVIAWSDGYTYFLGNIFVRGGSVSGDGGFVETSGKESLSFDGYVDRTAANGASGMLLLDPKNITVAATGTMVPSGGLDFNSGGDGNDSTISASSLETALNSGGVTLQANNNITFNADVAATGASGLTLEAGKSIFINSIITLNGGSFTATINDSGADSGSASSNYYRTADRAEFTMGSGSSITTNGGNITIATGTFTDSAGGRSTLAGNIGNITLLTLNTSGVTPSAAGGDGTNAGRITVTNTHGNIIVNGQIEARGGTGSAGVDGLSGSAGGVGGAGGNGGNVEISADRGNINVNSVILASGGAGEVGGAGGANSSGGTGGAGGTGGLGGNAGVIDLRADRDMTINASISASGGAGGMGGTGGDDGVGNITGAGGDGGDGGNAQLILLGVGRDLTVNADILAAGGAFGTSGSGVSGFPLPANGGPGTANTITFNGDGSDNIFTFSDVTLTGSLITVAGGSGNDQLVRTGTLGNTWTVTGSNGGTLAFANVGVSAIQFSGMESLIGSAAQDTFNITTGSLSGLLDGGGGASDALTFSASNVTLRLSNTLSHTDAVNDTGALNVARIESITAAVGSTGNTILGENAATTWTVNGINRGIIAPTTGAATDNTVSFQNIGTLTGGDQIDAFSVTAAGRIGTLNGNGGNDSFTVTAAAGAVTTLNGGNNDDTFDVTASAGAIVTINGDNGNDDIEVTGAMSGAVDGGTGTNTLTFNGTAGNDVISLGAGVLALSSSGSSFSYTNLNDITLNAQGGIDSLALNGAVLPSTGTLRLSAETVTGIGTSAVTAGTLILDNVGQFGSAGALIATDITNLQLTAASQIYINELNGLDVTMATAGVNSASVFQVAGTTAIDANGSALVLNDAANDFETINISNAASIVLRDRNEIAGGTMDVGTGNITLSAVDGIGTVSALNTTAANLTVTNTTGAVSIANSGPVSASVITAGNINFTNNGNLTIRQLNTYGGRIPLYESSSYGAHINLTVDNGGIYGTNYAAGSPSPIPDIVAQTFTGLITSGIPGNDFGTDGMPVNVMVRERFDLTAINQRAFIQFIPSRPPGTITATLTVSNDSVGGINTQLLEVDSLDEFDPAIFTDVRNYYYEDVAIMLPADQRLGAGEEDEDEDNVNKLKGADKATCDPQPGAGADRAVDATCEKSEEKQGRS